MTRHHPVYGIAEGSASAALVAAASAALAADSADFDLVARSDVPMCVVDATAPDMPIVFANAAFLDLSGYGRDEVVGRNCRLMQGPETAPEDAAAFRRGIAGGRPFQVSIVNHRKSGEAFRNEVFVSPVRESDGRIARFIGIQVALTPPGKGLDEEGVAALRHQFRNQIQTMTSLVSLLGQRVSPGEGRDAFEDLRARFEAICVVQTDELAVDGPVAADLALARLAERVIQLYDPERRWGVTFASVPLRTSARRAALLAQILTELLIDLFRNTPAPEGRGAASATIDVAADAAVRIRVVAEAGGPDLRSGSTDLGLAIVASLARSLGGSFTPRGPGARAAEATVPAEAVRR